MKVRLVNVVVYVALWDPKGKRKKYGLTDSVCQVSLEVVCTRTGYKNKWGRHLSTHNEETHRTKDRVRVQSVVVGGELSCS